MPHGAGCSVTPLSPIPSVRVIVLALIAALLAASVLIPASGAHAASRGSGFGAWAPVSPYGWHGSMLVGGVHTYCILPGAPAPTGHTTDRGVRTSVLGLTAQQLAGINLVVTKYGQTNDSVQAAGVAWAVRAIADWDAALHHYGYRGRSLAGAVNWTFSALAPEHNAAVQQRAVAYYEEGRRVSVGGATPTGDLLFTTSPADHRAGTVTARTKVAGATGSITLTGATFVRTGTPTLTGAVPGVAYEIRSAAAPGRAHSVSATGRFSAGPAAAIRHFTTPGGQDTAGPGGAISFELAGADASPRAPGFVPAITTHVGARYAPPGPFVDDVAIRAEDGEWPRDADGRFLPLRASATVYRTEEPPVLSEEPPAEAVAVGELRLETDPAIGPDADYRVTSDWQAVDPGFYTAVWSIHGTAQADPAALRLPAGFEWVERFGEPGQITMVPDVSSRAVPTAEVGEPVVDTIVVDGPLPKGGLDVSSSLYRAVAGVAPADTCVVGNLVWASPSHRVTARGEITVVSPPTTEAGTFYWQERAVDADGALVHLGACGIAAETSRVTSAPAPTPAPTPSPPTPTPPAVVPPPPPTGPAPSPTVTAPAPGAPSPGGLARTGVPADSVRTMAGAGIAVVTLGATLFSWTRRRRFEAPSAIG